MVREVKLPDWYYNNDLQIKDDEGWYTIRFFAGPNEDQQGLLFLRVDDADEGCAIVGLSPDDAKKIYDHLGDWLSWCYERKLS